MRKFFTTWLLVWLIASTGVFSNAGGVIEVSPNAYKTAYDMVNNNVQLQVYYNKHLESLKAITVPPFMISGRLLAHISYLVLSGFAHADIYATYRFSDGSKIKIELTTIAAMSGEVKIKFHSAEDAEGKAFFQKPATLTRLAY